MSNTAWIDSFMAIFGYRRVNDTDAFRDKVEIIPWNWPTVQKPKPKAKKIKWPSRKAYIRVRDLMKKSWFTKREIMMYVSEQKADEVLAQYKAKGKIRYNQRMGRWENINKR